MVSRSQDDLEMVGVPHLCVFTGGEPIKYQSCQLASDGAFFLLVDAWSFIITYFLVWWGLAPLSIFQPALKALNYHHGSPYNSCRKDLRKPSSGWRVGSFWDVGSHHWGNAPRLWQTILSMAIGGHFRILDWRYLPYIREYPHKIWSYLSIDLIYLGSTSINCTCSHRSPAFKLNLGFQILHPTGSWRVSTVSWSNYSCR